MIECINCCHATAVRYEGRYTGYYTCRWQPVWVYRAVCNIGRYKAAA